MNITKDDPAGIIYSSRSTGNPKKEETPQNIDELDRGIIKILEKDSRSANTEIANRLGISETTVRNRIRKLVKNGVIRNIAIVNHEVLGYQIHLIVGVHVDPKKIETVAEELRKKDSVFFVGYATGRYDIMFVAFFHTIEEEYRFFVKELPAIDGVMKTESSSILKMVKAKHVWGVSLGK